MLSEEEHNNSLISDKKTSSKSINWKRNLIIISIAQFLTMVGMSSVIPFMPIFVKELGITNQAEASVWSGLIFAGPYFLSIIATPLWGVLGDKYGRKQMLVRALFGLSLAVLLMGFSQNVYQLFALRVLQGAISGMIAAALAFVSANTPSEKSGYAIGILQSSLSAGNIVGPFAGGIISDITGIRSVFYLVSFLTFISAILIIFFVKELKNKDAKITEFSIINNFKYAVNNKEIRFILLLIILSQAGINYTSPIFPFFIEILHAPAQYLSTITGSLIAIIGIMSVIFAPYWGKRNDKKDYKKTVRISNLIIGLMMLLHTIVPNYIYLYPIRTISGIFFAAVLPSLYTGLNRLTPLDNKGGVMGIASSANLVGQLLGYSTCGFVASWFGFDITFIISSILLFAVSLLIRRKVKKV